MESRIGSWFVGVGRQTPSNPGHLVIFEAKMPATRENYGDVFSFIEGPYYLGYAREYAQAIRGMRRVSEVHSIRQGVSGPWVIPAESNPDPEILRSFEESFICAAGIKWSYLMDTRTGEENLQVSISQGIWLPFRRWYANRLEEGRG